MPHTQDKSTWAIGGGLLIGLGVGFFFLPGSPMAFVGSLIAGLGLGLLVTVILSTLAARGPDRNDRAGD